MEHQFTPPKRYYRIAIGVFFFFQGFCFASWAARIPDFKAFFALSEGQLGTLLWAFPLGQLLGVPLAGWLTERYTSRRMLLVAVLLYPACLCALALVGNVWAFGGVLFFMGLVANLHNLSVNTQAVGVEAMYGRSIMATFHGCWSLAGFAAGLAGSVMAAFSVRPLAHYAGVMVFGLLVFGLAGRFLLREDGGRAEAFSGEDVDAAPVGEAGAAEKPTFNIFKGMDGFVYLLGFIALGSMLCEGVMYDWSAVYYKEYLFFDDAYIRFGYTACMLAMAGCRFLADFIVNRFGAATVVRWSGILAASGFLLMVLCHNLVWVTVGAALVGAGVSSVVPVCYGVVGRHKGVVPGRAINAVSTIGFTGFAVSPPLIGYLAEWIGLRWVFVCVAALALLIALLAVKLKEE